jgi:hypothetical protein
MNFQGRKFQVRKGTLSPLFQTVSPPIFKHTNFKVGGVEVQRGQGPLPDLKIYQRLKIHLRLELDDGEASTFTAQHSPSNNFELAAHYQGNRLGIKRVFLFQDPC